MYNINFANNSWQDLRLLNGYIQHNSSYNVPQFRKEGNKIFIRGMVRNPSNNNQIIGNLPVGYRPKKNYYFPAVMDDGFTPLVISPDGNIKSYMYRKDSWLDFGEINISLD